MRQLRGSSHGRSFSLSFLIATMFAANISAAAAQTIRVPSYAYKANETGRFAMVKDTTVSTGCLLFLPTLRCLDFDQDQILAFFNEDKPLAYINQVKSIYNGASSSATVSADIGTLTFGSGWQLTLGTNIQAGPSGSTAVASGAVPTLSATAAAQATQNLLYGGTIS